MGRQLKFHINALNQEKEQLSSIVNSMADGVITLNRHGDMIVTNPPSEQFLQDLYLDKNISQENSDQQLPEVLEDRKSTRLNSSHVAISYAVFCLKKKKIQLTVLKK